MENMIIDSNGISRDLYNLPDSFECKELNLTGEDLSSFKFPTHLKCESVHLTAHLQKTKNLKLPKKVDFSNCKNVCLSNYDFSGVEELIAPRGYLSLDEAKNLPKRLVLTGSSDVDLYLTDLSGVELIGMPSDKLKLSLSKNLPETLNCESCKSVSLYGADLKGVKRLIGSQKDIDMDKATNLPKYIDLSKTEKAKMSECDFAKTNEVLWPTQYLCLHKAQNLPERLDFRNTNNVNLACCGLLGHSIKWPKERVDLAWCYTLPFKLDFRKVKESVNLFHAFSTASVVLLPPKDSDFKLKNAELDNCLMVLYAKSKNKENDQNSEENKVSNWIARLKKKLKPADESVNSQNTAKNITVSKGHTR